MEIEIKEEIQIGDIILEAGDKIQVLESYETDIASDILDVLEGKTDSSFADLVRRKADDLSVEEVLDAIKSDSKLKARMDILMKRTDHTNPLWNNKVLIKYWNK